MREKISQRRQHDVMITTKKILCLDMSVKDNDKSFWKEETNVNSLKKKIEPLAYFQYNGNRSFTTAIKYSFTIFGSII